MENKDIILFILTIIILYLLFEEMKINNNKKECFTSVAKEYKGTPIGDIKYLIKNIINDELSKRKLSNIPKEGIKISDSLNHLGVIVNKIKNRTPTKINNELESSDVIICDDNLENKYKLSVKDGNLTINKLDKDGNIDYDGKISVIGSSIVKEDINVKGDLGSLNTKNNIDIIGGNLKLSSGNIVSQNDLQLEANNKIKTYNFINDTGNYIYANNNGSLHLNWDKSTPIYFNNIYTKNNIKTEGILHFRKHNYGDYQQENERRLYYHNQAKLFNIGFRYMKYYPYSHLGTCEICKKSNPYSSSNLGASKNYNREKEEEFKKEQDKKWGLNFHKYGTLDFYTYSLIRVGNEISAQNINQKLQANI